MADYEFVQFSEESNALDYLEKAVEFIHRVKANPRDWKWVILSIHGALYGFMICALKGTDYVLVLDNKSRTERLISFSEALRRCKDPQYMDMTVNSHTLSLSHKQEDSLDYIQRQFRDRFVHYQPGAWSIEWDIFPGAVIDGLEVTRFLALETGNYTYLTVEDRKRIDTLVADGIEFLRCNCFHEPANNLS
jgi:hypothetical protein